MRKVLEEEYQKAEAENRLHQFLGMIISSDRRNIDQRRYNSPTTTQIVALLKSSNGQPPAERDVRGHLLRSSRGRRFIEIDTQKPISDPMTYPLLFLQRDDVWHAKMPYSMTNTNERDEAAAAVAVMAKEDEDMDLLWPDERLLNFVPAIPIGEVGPDDDEEPKEPEPEERLDEEEHDPQRLNRGSGQRKRLSASFTAASCP